MNTKIPKAFMISIHYPDLITEIEEVDSPTIHIMFDNFQFNFHRKYKDSKNSGPCKIATTSLFTFYNDKKTHEALLKEAEKMIDAYKIETHRDLLGKDVPFEKYKNTKLIKFVLSKL
jgi:hypothetical protein